ncbi:MAG: right-handed parallel beta-helix repeat-containing protein [Arenimonas sp.]
MIRINASFAMLLTMLLLAASAALFPRVALATPSLDGCTGVLHAGSNPQAMATADAPGIWCLDQDLASAVVVVDSYFAMVVITADDVTIDCRGYRIEFQGTAEFSYGVSALGPRQRSTIRNCAFRGFTNAISAYGEDFLIEDNVVEASRQSIFGDGTAINANGSGTIRRNRIHDAVSRAISTKGGSIVRDNLIDGVVDPGGRQAVGIEIMDPTSAEVRGNTIRGLGPVVESAQHIAISFYAVNGSSGALVVDNVLVHAGADGSLGLSCGGLNIRVADNIIEGFIAPLNFGCVDTGDNDISP